MAHSFRFYTPEQPALLPASPQDWLSEDHLAYSVRDVVQQLDLSALEAAYALGGCGTRAYPPRMLVSVLLYAWCRKVYSSRQFARLCVDDLGGRYLAGGHQPDFRTLNLFRLQHGERLQGLFQQSLRLCQRAGMVSLGHVALDGTQLSANASKPKAMSYGRMTEEEGRLAIEAGAMLRQAEAADQAEDEEFGQGALGSPLSEELRRRESRLAKLREAKAALEEEARQAAQAQLEEREAKEAARQAEGEGKLGGRKPRPPQEARPKAKAQRNFTDPESRTLKSGTGAWVQGYNGQVAVDQDWQVIVACALSAQAADVEHLPEMLGQVAENTGCKPDELSADAGYFGQGNVEHLEQASIEALTPPDRERHGTPADLLAERRPEEVAALPVKERQRYQVSMAEGRRRYACRKKTVEPALGQINGCPAAPGFQGLLRRGLRKCREEWPWVCAAHNVPKYIRCQRQVSGYSVAV